MQPTEWKISMVGPEVAETVHLELTVNARKHSLEVAAHELLLDVLRSRLGLTGTKRSCDMQVCGACTVLIDGLPVSACCTLAWDARERQIETIEGLADDRLHPIQQAFIEHFALQCGFCTPGMIMTVYSLLSRREEGVRLEEADIAEYMTGSICRCTGYRSILEAVKAVALTVGTKRG